MQLQCPWTSDRYCHFARNVRQSSRSKRFFGWGYQGWEEFFSGAGDADVAFGFSTVEAQPAGMASYPPVGSQVHNNRPEYVQPEEIWTKDVCHQCFFLPSALLCRAGEGAATGQCLSRRIHSVFFSWDCWAAQWLLGDGSWRGEARINQRVQDHLICGKDL